MRKTYRALHYDQICIPVSHHGKQVYCEFRGSIRYPEHIRGSYTTKRKEIQDKLEAHPLFNKQFKLENTNANDRMIAKHDIPEQEYTEVKDITSLNKAKQYMNKKYGVKLSEMKNRNEVLGKAEELFIVFPDLVLIDR